MRTSLKALSAAAAVSVAVALVPTAAAVSDATWTYEVSDAPMADEALTVDVSLVVGDDPPLRRDQPLAHRHFLLDGDGVPQEGLEVDWVRGDASGTATIDADGAFLLPNQTFRASSTPGLFGTGDEQQLTMTLPGGDYVLFSDLVDATPPTSRVSGASRYATAAEASRRTFEAGTEVVYVASGESFADALAAGPAAAHLGAPLLLVTSDGVPQPTRDELKRLAPDTIVVVGGAASVSAEVTDVLLAPYASRVRRVAGATRFETAANVALDAWDDEVVERAYVANGRRFPDALGAAAAAAVDDVPVLLVETDVVPQPTSGAIVELDPTTLTIAGGQAVITSEVFNSLRTLTGAATRRAGDDRYGTSAALADRTGQQRDLIVATGQDFPDALTAGPIAGARDADLLLVRPDRLPTVIGTRAAELAPVRIIGRGGEAAVATAVLEALDQLRSPLDAIFLDPVVVGGDLAFSVGGGPSESPSPTGSPSPSETPTE